MNESIRDNSIPSNFENGAKWNFAEKTYPDFRVIEEDIKNDYIRFEYRHPGLRNKLIKDYFFARNGLPKSSRIQFLPLHDESDDHVIVTLWGENTSEYSISKVLINDRTVKNLHGHLDIVRPVAGRRFMDHLGHKPYSFQFNSSGDLVFVETGCTMQIDKDTFVEAPTGSYVLYENASGLEKEDWRFEKDSVINLMHNGFLIGENVYWSPTVPKELERLEKMKQESTFTIEQKIMLDVDRNGREVPFFIFTLLYKPTGMTKTLRVPLRIDMDQVINASFSKPPYPVQSVGKVESVRAPWTEIDRIVGASLSQSERINRLAI